MSGLVNLCADGYSVGWIDESVNGWVSVNEEKCACLYRCSDRRTNASVLLILYKFTLIPRRKSST